MELLLYPQLWRYRVQWSMWSSSVMMLWYVGCFCVIYFCEDIVGICWCFTVRMLVLMFCRLLVYTPRWLLMCLRLIVYLQQLFVILNLLFIYCIIYLMLMFCRLIVYIPRWLLMCFRLIVYLQQLTCSSVVSSIVSSGCFIYRII